MRKYRVGNRFNKDYSIKKSDSVIKKTKQKSLNSYFNEMRNILTAVVFLCFALINIILVFKLKEIQKKLVASNHKIAQLGQKTDHQDQEIAKLSRRISNLVKVVVDNR